MSRVRRGGLTSKGECKGSCILYCVSCNRHSFRVDANTVQAVEVLVLKCPDCGKLTKVGFDSKTQELLVVPAGAERSQTRNVGVKNAARGWIFSYNEKCCRPHQSAKFCLGEGF